MVDERHKKQSKKRVDQEAKLFFAALRDGSLADIPADMRPKITDIESRFSCVKLLRLLRDADPEYRQPETVSYMSLLARRAFQILRISCSYLLHGEQQKTPTSSEVALLDKLAVSEGIHSVLRAASGRDDEDDSIKAIRRYILMQHAWKNVKDDLSKSNEPIVLIPLIPSEVLSLYRAPWLRCGNSFSFITSENMIRPLKQILSDQGFIPDQTDPLESERVRSITFRNRDDVRFVVFLDTFLGLSGAFGDSMSGMFNELIQSNREMSMAEYALLLSVKLHEPNMYRSSACLCDLLDLALMLGVSTKFAEDPAFIRKLNELGLEGSWFIINSICNAALLTSQEPVLNDMERNYIVELIGRPYLRFSYLERLSMSLLEQDRHLDPPEYAVSSEKHLVYLVNSKVACSSIKASMLDEEVPDDYTVHRSAFKHGLYRRELSDEERDYFIFTFVRNPFARLVSCYESKYHVDIDRYKKKFDFRDYLNGYLYDDEGFDEFIRKVCALPYRLMDRHFRPQYDLIFDAAGENDFDFIGRFERLEEDYLTIQNKYRLRPLPHLNRTGTDDWMTYYTPETAELVYRTFHKDIKHFGYEECYSYLLASIQLRGE